MIQILKIKVIDTTVRLANVGIMIGIGFMINEILARLGVDQER